ncbi:MAG: DUF3568 family protein [Thermodesulfovibrionia bacterium]|nr:DUF3568 family protein [Thermodesulfovibrionia bacterium]
MKKFIRLTALLLSLVFLCGCEVVLLGAGAGLGVGTYRFIEGNLERTYPLSYTSAWDSTNTALSNLYISVTSSINEDVKGTIESVRKDGIKVVVVLTDRGQNVTDISIRVGFWGNREDAERMHDEIKRVAGL